MRINSTQNPWVRLYLCSNRRWVLGVASLIFHMTVTHRLDIQRAAQQKGWISSAYNSKQTLISHYLVLHYDKCSNFIMSIHLDVMSNLSKTWREIWKRCEKPQVNKHSQTLRALTHWCWEDSTCGMRAVHHQSWAYDLWRVDFSLQQYPREISWPLLGHIFHGEPPREDPSPNPESQTTERPNWNQGLGRLEHRGIGCGIPAFGQIFWRDWVCLLTWAKCLLCVQLFTRSKCWITMPRTSHAFSLFRWEPSLLPPNSI